MALLIQMGDIMVCEEKIGFYLTSMNQTITDEMLEALEITREQIEEVRENLEDQLLEAETTLTE